MVDGVPTTVTSTADTARVSITVTGQDWSLNAAARSTQGLPQPLAQGGVMQVPVGGGVLIQGSNYQPGSTVVIYVLNPSRELGTITVSSDGAFRGLIPLPGSMAQGNAVLQVNGPAPTMKNRSVSLGMRVVKAAPGQVFKRSTTVYFASGSSKLTAASLTKLATLAASVPKGAKSVRVVTTGFLQPTPETSNYPTLVSLRANNVVAQLKKVGLPGQYRIARSGRASESTPLGRKVVVSVTFRY